MSDDAEHPAEYLRQLGQAGEGPHDIAKAALMLAALDHIAKPVEPYLSHLDEIAKTAREEAHLCVSAEDGARYLAGLMVGQHGYDGDRLSYDDPRNADMIAVIERRRGLPVALGILYIHAARAAGFEAAGLSTPGHFLLRLGLNGQEALIDPFNGGASLDRESFGGLPGTAPESWPDPRINTAVSDVDVLLRLQNNLKLRALNTGERTRALEIAKRMVLIAPRSAELWMDLARLSEASGSLGAAQRAYEACLTLAKPGQALHNESALNLQALKRRLN